jgi:type I restriction enzyme S subunit
MSGPFPLVPLGGTATPVTRPETPMPGTSYRQVGVKLWGQGAYEREPIDGSETQYKTLSRMETDDIVVNKIWARNGSVAVVTEALAGSYGSGEFPTFAPNRERLEPRWFHWLTKTRYFWDQCDEKSRGTSGKNRIRPEQFLAVEIPLPPLEEQRRIVARIEVQATKIAEAQGLRGVAIAEMRMIVSGEATKIFAALDACQSVPLARLGPDDSNPIQTGPFGAQLHSSEFVESGVPVLNVGNVTLDGLDARNLDHVLTDKAATLSRYAVEEDDLLFARTGATLGKVCLVPPGCNGWLMTGHLFRVRLDQSRVNPRFALVALRDAASVKEQVFTQVRGATRPGFNTTLLSRVSLPLPGLSEQQRIVAYLDGLQAQVDAVKRLQAETAVELDALLPAVLDKAFKGEL